MQDKNTRELHPRKVFIGGLSWVTNEERLQSYFEECGAEIESIVIMRDNLGRSRGFGFVIFAHEKFIPPIIGNHHILDGRTIEVKRAIPKGKVKTKKVFVGGIPIGLDNDEFREYFESFGVVTEACIIKNRKTGCPRGFGFVSFKEEEAVNYVLSESHELQGKVVEVKLAEKKKLRNDSRELESRIPYIGMQYPMMYPYAQPADIYTYNPGSNDIFYPNNYHPNPNRYIYPISLAPPSLAVHEDNHDNTIYNDILSEENPAPRSDRRKFSINEKETQPSLDILESKIVGNQRKKSRPTGIFADPSSSLFSKVIDYLDKEESIYERRSWGGSLAEFNEKPEYPNQRHTWNGW
eukprot:TRINITY_DN0_c1_g1_i1.p1 TRINITY_DN0_c1_g1~~TRINITY_DN0_c1_g1_i1.p1  ORF type:complete len:351 (-),score=87.23 TRINITY_DN0_c1_g1_i1:208-1260(-)